MLQARSICSSACPTNGYRGIRGESSILLQFLTSTNLSSRRNTVDARRCSVSRGFRCSAFLLRLQWQKYGPTTLPSILEKQRLVCNTDRTVEHLIDGITDGFSRPVYLINGQQPAPLIEANEDDTLEVFVKNELPVETTLHWHGTLCCASINDMY